MAYWQRRYILKQHTLASDSATYTVDLPESNKLSALLLKLAWTNGTTNNQGRGLPAEIDKVEVIADGSFEIVSLTGWQLYKMAHFAFGRPPTQVRTQVGSAVQQVILPILFGRYIGDPEYYLDCSLFTSLELKITYSPTISATVGFATGTGVLDVVGHMYMGGAPGPQMGYLKTTQKYSFTSVASGDEEIELPRAHPYRSIMVRAFESGIADGVDVTELKLEVNDGEFTPYVGRWVDIQQENQESLKIVPVECGVAHLTDADTLETEVGTLVSIRMNTAAAFAAATDWGDDRPASVAGSLVTIAGQLNEGSGTWGAVALDTVDRAIHWEATGIGVGHCVLIPFDLGGDMNNCLPSRDYDRVKLILTQGGAGAAVEVVLQEVLTP